MSMSNRGPHASSADALDEQTSPRSDPTLDGALPSWREGDAKAALLEFVRGVTDPGASTYVPVRDRIAVFDNDGTLWCEQPIPVQGFFAVDRLRALAEADPSLYEHPSFKAILAHDLAAMAKLGKREIVELIFATHSGMTPEEFDTIARNWLSTACHPRFGRRFTRCAYQPMLELLGLLRINGFSTFIVSGGGVDFIRAFAEETYGIRRQNVIGSSAKTRLQTRENHVDLIKLAEVGSFDDKDTKVTNIGLHIGRRPILAVGNSDGDLSMMRYVTAGEGPRLALLVHHDDAEREYAYDKDFSVSPLRVGLDEARSRGWTVVSMKHDFREVFSLESRREVRSSGVGARAYP